MSPNSIPKGSVIPYLLFLKFKNIYNFEIEIIQRNKKKINSKSNSFNSYFMKFDKFKKKKEKNNPYDLYFFTFNQCYTDLLSCLDDAGKLCMLPRRGERIICCNARNAKVEEEMVFSQR